MNTFFTSRLVPEFSVTYHLSVSSRNQSFYFMLPVYVCRLFRQIRWMTHEICNYRSIADNWYIRDCLTTSFHRQEALTVYATYCVMAGDQFTTLRCQRNESSVKLPEFSHKLHHRNLHDRRAPPKYCTRVSLTIWPISSAHWQVTTTFLRFVFETERIWL